LSNGLHIGILMRAFDKARVLQQGLLEGGREVAIYHTAQECMQTTLTAKFTNQPLPHRVILVDLDLGDSITGPEMIRRLRQFIPREELTFILMNGRSKHEEAIISDNLIDIRAVYNSQSLIIKEIHKITAMGGQE
jgi:hypothetical protein